MIPFWKGLLEKDKDARIVAPWLGGRRVFTSSVVYRLDEFPPEYGWYLWRVRGRKAKLVKPTQPDSYYFDWQGRTVRGYLVGDRLIPEDARAELNLGNISRQAPPVYLVWPGLDRFIPTQAMRVDGKLLFQQQLFPVGPEDAVRDAYVERCRNVNHIKGVPPALDLAFQFMTHRRDVVEARREELRKAREEERRLEEAKKNLGTGVGRRRAAVADFDLAAREALAVGGAVFLDSRDGVSKREKVVQFRFANRRFECVVHRDTLRIIDSGICLVDHVTAERGDTYFTLESLPGVIQQAIREHRLVVYRHVER